MTRSDGRAGAVTDTGSQGADDCVRDDGVAGGLLLTPGTQAAVETLTLESAVDPVLPVEDIPETENEPIGLQYATDDTAATDCAEPNSNSQTHSNPPDQVAEVEVKAEVLPAIGPHFLVILSSGEDIPGPSVSGPAVLRNITQEVVFDSVSDCTSDSFSTSHSPVIGRGPPR